MKLSTYKIYLVHEAGKIILKCCAAMHLILWFCACEIVIRQFQIKNKLTQQQYKIRKFTALILSKAVQLKKI